MAQVTLPTPVAVCDPIAIHDAATLTLRQKSCFLQHRLFSPSALLGPALFGGLAQWRNQPYQKHLDFDHYERRFALRYARSSARSVAESVFGYFNHEDPRPRPVSLSPDPWVRSRSALAGVIVTKNEYGNRRIALSRLAGALASGLAGMACSPHFRATPETAFRLAGFTYSGYFAKALYAEFKPDIRVLRLKYLKR